jgi:hypothetical protein
MPMSPENYNRIRDANAHYGAAREALGTATAVAEANPSEATAKDVEAAEVQARKALERFYRALGAADVRPTVIGT